MVTPITGYSRDEFVEQLKDISGVNSSSFTQQCNNNITSWIQQFYCMFDWNFVYKNGVADNFKFTSVNNQSDYTIDTATVGFESNSTYIESVYTQTVGFARKLIKQPLQYIRAGDPGQIATGYPMYWCPSGDKGILLYPTPVTGNGAGEVIFMDGKVIGQEINSNVQIPIPYQRQELFMQYCLYKCLRRQRDPSATTELKIFEAEFKMNVADELREEESNLQVRTVNEQLGNVLPTNLNSLLWYTPPW